MTSPSEQRRALENSSHEEVVQHSLAIITMTEYCRNSAEALGKCNQEHGSRAESACAAKHGAFVACTKENFQKAFVDLRKIAAKQCHEEVAAYQRCKAEGGGVCAQEDLAALGCAARLVLHSFRSG